MTDKFDHREVGRQIATVGGALVGVGVVALLQLITLGVLDRSLRVSVYSFSLSIPLLSYALAVRMGLLHGSYGSHSGMARLTSICFIAGMLLTFVGLGAIFWHLSPRAGLLFSTLTFVLMSLLGRYRRLSK